MKYVLVSGGAGYIGSHTVALLAESGYFPIVYDNFSRGHRDFVLWGDCVEGDISDTDTVLNVLEKYKIKDIIHFAAFAYVGESVANPSLYYANNVVGTYKLLDAARIAGVENFIFSSTCATYGIPASSPINESFPQNPINPYGWSKLMIEKMLFDYKAAYGINYGILRYFNAAGADPMARIGERHCPETHLIPLVLDAAAGIRDSVTIFGSDYNTPDGTCIRDYIHVADLALAHLKVLDKMGKEKQSYIFNLGNECGVSVAEIIDAVKNVTGKQFKVVQGARRPGDPDELVANASLAAEVLDWRPKFADIRIIIEHAWKWHLKENSNK